MTFDEEIKVVVEEAWDEEVHESIGAKVIHSKLDRCKRELS